MIETLVEAYKHALRTRKCLNCVSFGACDDSTGQNPKYYQCGKFEEREVENNKPFVNLTIDDIPKFQTKGDVKPYWPLSFNCGYKDPDPVVNQEVPALGVFTTHLCYDNVLPLDHPSFAPLLKQRTYNNGFRGIYDRGIVNVTYVPLYKVDNVAERSLRKYRTGAITGEYLLRSFCLKPTIRGAAGYDNYDHVEPVWTDELTVHKVKVNDNGSVEKTYRRTALRNLQKHDERDGPHVGDKPEHLDVNYSKDEWKAQLVAHEEAKEARKAAKTGLVEDEDEDSGVAWGVPEFSENYVLGIDPVYRYEPLIQQEVNFYGKGPYKKDYANQKERNYWIGEIYLRNAAAGYFSQNLKKAIADYFDVSERTVMYCAAKVRESHDILQFTRSTEISGDWRLKTFRSQRSIKPWKTCDGLRPWSMWLNRGTTDARYDVLRQAL